MNLLITGGAGYIGCVLVPRLLAAGHRVTVLDILRHGQNPDIVLPTGEGLTFIQQDIQDQQAVDNLLNQGEFTAIIHLAAIADAAECEKNPDVADELHVNVTRELAERAIQHGVRRFILASTCSVYGATDSPGQLLTEADHPQPLSVYGRTKLAGEEALLALSDQLETVVLRFATAFGMSPRMRWDLLVNEFTRDGSAGKTIELYSADLARPYLHVADLAQALLLTLEAPATRVSGKFLNVAREDENYSKLEIVEIIRSHLPNLSVVNRSAPGVDRRDYRVSGQHFGECTGFVPGYRVADGVKEIVEACRGGL